jgi:glycosyltransferase involved in cell wall biosynthesis
VPELVAVAEQLLAPVPGGTGRYTRELLRALASTTPHGWEVTSLVSSSGDPRAARVEGVTGPRIVRLPRRALVAAWERGFGVGPRGRSVHAMTPFAPPRSARRAVVVTVHDAVPWTHPETLTPRGVAWHRRMITRAARQADALIVPTAAVAAELARHVEITAPVRVIGEGVTPSLVHAPDSDEIAERLRLPPRYLLALGTIEPRKGFGDLVRALARPDAPHVPLLVVGPQGWGGIDLPAIAQDRGLPPDRLRLLGRIGDAELAVALRRASALVVPSLAEGFGLPVLEAMEMGTPVVHSDAPALVEVAGGAGLTALRGDTASLVAALNTVIGDGGRAARLREAGRQRAEAFSWERTAREVWRVHQELRD